MTFEQLEIFLNEEKKKDAELRGMDMCGRYARCRYCRRYLDYPCARAHNALVDARASRTPDRIPDWLLPEPPVSHVFGAEKAEEGQNLPQNTDSSQENGEMHSTMRDVIEESAPSNASEEGEISVPAAEPTEKKEPVRESYPREREGRRYVISTLRRGARDSREEPSSPSLSTAEPQEETSATEQATEEAIIEEVNIESLVPEVEARAGRGVVSLSPYDGGKEVRYGIAKLKRKKSE